MQNAIDNIRKSLQKRQEALERQNARRAAFLDAQKTICKEIAEARVAWNKPSEKI